MPKPPTNDFQGTEIEKIRRLFKTKAGKSLPSVSKMEAKDVREWFTRNMKMLASNVNVNKIMRDNPERLVPGNRISSRTLGMMMMWFYDPKHKKTLPYYDRLPVGFIVQLAPHGFYAINLHYLNPQDRMRLFAALIDIGGSRIGEQRRLLLTYRLLKGAARTKLFRPCFKRYLANHVKSRFYIVPPDEWHIFLSLPNVERFEKGGGGNKGNFGGSISKYQIWSQSRKKADIS